MTFQVLREEINDRVLENWKLTLGKIIVLDNWREASPLIPIICNGNLKNNNVRYWLENKFPALYIARGYLGNHIHKRRKWWRISVNGWANLKIKNIPYPKWKDLGLPFHPWKVKEIRNVLIAPSKMTTEFWKEHPNGTLWQDYIKNSLPKSLSTRVRIKGKTTSKQRWTTLWDDLDWADLVISQSSAITCEAFWYGKQVISTRPCNTWSVQRLELTSWNNPDEPNDRNLWYEHLAWSQFTTEQIHSGEAFQLVIKYLGNPLEINHNYEYSF